MKQLRWQIIIVVLGLIAIGILLISQQSTILPGIEPVFEPETGGLYSEALIGEMGRLNPLLDFYNPVDQDVNRLLYSSLIRFDDRGLPFGDLADSWGISQDGLVYNISIKPNAVWHDGEPVTSSDVLFTVELMRDEASILPEDLLEFWNQVEVNILDETTLQFRLPEPFAPFLDYLTFGIVPEHLLNGLSYEEIIDTSFNTNPVGSGPYLFERIISENGRITGVQLHLFEDYFGASPYIEDIIFRYYPDTISAMTAYINEEVSGISLIDSPILQRALQNPTLNLNTSRLPDLALVYLNLSDPSLPFFQDSDVRRALLTGINRQAIIDRYLDGQALIAHGPILPGSWAYYEGIEKIEYDPELAINILKDAGYKITTDSGNIRSKDGVALAFEFIHLDEEPFISIAQLIQRDWEKIGVKAVLRAVTREQLIQDHLEPRSFDAALVELNLSPSPDPDPYPFWHQTQIVGGQNYAGWDDPQASEFLEQARIDVDYERRLNRYQNFQVRFTRVMPALPLYHPVYTYGVDNQVLGVTMGPVYALYDRFNTISSWFIQASQAIEPRETGTPQP